MLDGSFLLYKKVRKSIPDIGYDSVTTPEPVKFKTLEYLKSISGTKTVTCQQGLAWWQPMKDSSGKYPVLFGEDFSFANFFWGHGFGKF